MILSRIKTAFSAKNILPGKLLVIDGNSGSGKHTQAELLSTILSISGFPNTIFYFPRYKERTASFIEDMHSLPHAHPYQKSLFYALDRRESIQEIQETLATGKTVIAVRYTTTNYGFQGAHIENSIERAKFFKWVDNLEYNILNIPRPHLSIILNTPGIISIKQKYLKEHSKEISEEKVNPSAIDFYNNVSEAFVQSAKLLPNIKIVDTSTSGKLLSPQDIHNKVWELVRRVSLRI